jgi:hypothetical protein
MIGLMGDRGLSIEYGQMGNIADSQIAKSAGDREQSKCVVRLVLIRSFPTANLTKRQGKPALARFRSLWSHVFDRRKASPCGQIGSLSHVDLVKSYDRSKTIAGKKALRRGQTQLVSVGDPASKFPAREPSVSVWNEE